MNKQTYHSLIEVSRTDPGFPAVGICISDIISPPFSWLRQPKENGQKLVTSFLAMILLP